MIPRSFRLLARTRTRRIHVARALLITLGLNIAALSLHAAPPAQGPIERDIAVTNMSAPPQAVIGAELTTTWTVVYSGTVNGFGSLSLGSWLSSDNTWDISDHIVGSITCCAEVLQPGATYNGSISGRIPVNIEPGLYYVITKVTAGFVDTSPDNDEQAQLIHVVSLPHKNYLGRVWR